MPPTLTPAPVAKRQRKKPILAWVLLGGLGVLVIGFVAGRIAIEAYLRSEKFRHFVGQKTGETLHAEVEVDPFQFTGSTIYSDRLKARGSAESPFAELELDQVRVDVSARRFFDHVWQVDQVDVQRLRWNLDGPRIDLPESLRPGQGPPKVEHPGSGLLPDRVEVGAATIHATDFQWSGGGLTGAVLEVAQRDGGWNITGHSGSLKHGTLPALDLDSLKLRLREPTLFLESAEFRQAGNGAVSASGEVRFGDHVDVQAKLKDISITPFLSEDWRVRLTGALGGDVHIQSALPLRGSPQFSGSLRLNDGHLEALPVLDQIAIFTGSAQFRHLALSKTAGDFTYDGTRLSVTNFEMESARLIRVEGSFTVENDRIDGSFQVGVTPPSLQWLPGAQERVFTTARAGYLWAPMRLTGPLAKPSEDLSPKLIAAAKGAVIDKATGLIREVTGGAVDGAGKPLQDAAKGVQDATDKALQLFLGK